MMNVTKNRFPLGKEFGNTYLTKRQVEVLRYLLHGLSAKRAAINMGISNRTVEKHIEILKYKLNSKKTAEMLAICVKHQLICHLF
jgi:DNA-binding CsgD family transcriptional regulator